MELTSEWFWPSLVCPIDHDALQSRPGFLQCIAGHNFPVIDGIPVLLPPNADPQYPAFKNPPADPAPSAANNSVDAFVQHNIIRTNGKLYRRLQGRLKRCPIPDLPLPDGHEQSFLDIGANWGRWSVAAARKNYRAIAFDSSLEAARAGRRVASQLGVDAAFVVGDARQMPFRNATFGVCFSFSVLQHLDKKFVLQVIDEIARVTQDGGRVLIQMANRYGLQQSINRAGQALRRNRSEFRVRHWTPRELRRTFTKKIGPTKVSAAGYFTLDAQPADLDILPWPEATLVRLSESLRRAARHSRTLTALADSLYVDSTNVPKVDQAF